MAVGCLWLFSQVVTPLAQEKTAPRIVFEHDGVGVTGFALYAQPQEGKVVRVDLGMVPADERGRRSASLPLPDGTYTLSVAAYNGEGESPRIPTSPARLSLRRSESQGSPAAGTAPNDAPEARAPTKGDRKNGILRRIWRVVVGDDVE